jgi:hypothetical protein
VRPSIPANYDHLALVGSNLSASLIKDLSPMIFPNRGSV